MKFLDAQQYARLRPYDTRVLREADESVAYVVARKGSSLTAHFRAPADGLDADAWRRQRAWASVSGWASFLVVPWAINPGLKELRVTVVARVSDVLRDQADVSNSCQAELRGGFLGNFGEGFSSALPQGTPPEYAPYSLVVPVGDWSGGVPPSMDVLALSFQSRLSGNAILEPNNRAGMLSDATITGPFFPWRPRSSTSNYSDPAGDGPNAAGEANEVTASVLAQWDGEDETYTAVLDHCYRWQDDVCNMWPWRSPASDPGTPEAQAEGPTRVLKWACAYLQFRSVQITEVYE